MIADTVQHGNILNISFFLISIINKNFVRFAGAKLTIFFRSLHTGVTPKTIVFEAARPAASSLTFVMK